MGWEGSFPDRLVPSRIDRLKSCRMGRESGKGFQSRRRVLQIFYSGTFEVVGYQGVTSTTLISGTTPSCGASVRRLGGME